MRVYLDNCCYNRPFDPQEQLRIRLETEAKLEVQSRDYTKWREGNMYIGESVHTTAARARAAAARLDASMTMA